MTTERKKICIQIAVIASLCTVLFAYSFVSAHVQISPVTATAQAIVADCSKVSGDHSECYETEVPSLYPKMTVPQIFDVVNIIRKADPSYQFCHVLAHKVGNRVVAEDPNQWLEAIPLNPPNGLCSNGYIHGVIVGRFSSEVLDDTTINKYVPDFAKACEPQPGWNPSDLDKAICYHGLGHLFDFITDAHLFKALSLCDQVATGQSSGYRQVCTEGVFMQIYQPLEPDDYALIARMPVRPNKDTVRTFCASYKDPKYVGACLRESWPFFQAGIFDGTGAGAFCSGQPNDTETANCYNSISSIVGRMMLGTPQKAVVACNNFPAKWQATCYSYSAEAVLEEDRSDASEAVALCAAGENTVGQSCIQDLVDHSRFMFGSNAQELDAFCKLVPASLQQQCIQNEQQ